MFINCSLSESDEEDMFKSRGHMYGDVWRCHGYPPPLGLEHKTTYCVLFTTTLHIALYNVVRWENTQSPLINAAEEDGVSGAFRNYLLMQLHQGRVMDFG